jgi:CheY-like chemotaxis protein
MTMLAGKRVLIAEDDPIIALLLEEVLAEAGATIIGPVATVAEGLRADAADAALLDLNLLGGTCAPLADHLAARGTPFVLTSGDAGATPLPAHPATPVLAKPFAPEAAVEALAALLAQA